MRPYGSGFLIFSDYGRPAIRLAALMEIPVVYVFTHDSIGVGEDGPTHQPVEQLLSLRAVPGLVTIRPADANEVAEAWRVILKFRHEPATLILTRQALPTLDRTRYASASGLAQGAYVLADAEGGKPEVLLIATGSEVSLCVAAHEQLAKEGIASRVVSMPSWELFDAPAAGVPRLGAAARGDRAGLRRAGLDHGLGALRGHLGAHHRDAHLRGLGAAQGPAEEVRVRPRERRGGGEGAARPRRRQMKVAVGADHAGFALKQDVAALLRKDGHTVIDVGTDSTEPVDYPDFAEAVGQAVLDGRAERAVLVCGSGVGASVAANKLPGIRAAICHDVYSAHQGVEHDDMNVLVLGGRIVGPAVVPELVRAFVGAQFTGEERHVRRLAKVKAIERRYTQGS